MANPTPVAAPPAVSPASRARPLTVQWRQFSFFALAASADKEDSLLIAPHLISRVLAVSFPAAAGSGMTEGLLVADLEGRITLELDGAVGRSWVAYGHGTESKGKGLGRCTHLATGEGRWKGILVTVGDDPSTQYPLLKVWDLATLTLASPPTLLRQSAISPSSSAHPVTSLVLSISLDLVVLGLASGKVVAFPGVGKSLEGGNGSLGKLRVLHEGGEPITSLGLTMTALPHSSSTTHKLRKPHPPQGLTTLFITTTSSVLALVIPAAMTSANALGTVKATVIDQIGAGVGCGRVLAFSPSSSEDSKPAKSRVDGIDVLEGELGGSSGTGEKWIVAREEGIYIYGAEGREGCLAFEGLKSAVLPLRLSRSAYLAIVTPPQARTAASNSATIRNLASASSSRGMSPAMGQGDCGGAGKDVTKVTIFDLENKFIAWSGMFDAAVREMWETDDGMLQVLLEDGKLFDLSELPLQASLSALFSRNLYALALSISNSRGASAEEKAEIYRRYGDFLYGRKDYDGAMGAYERTVGFLQAGYVIRKFLDAQRLGLLTRYLQLLHAKGLANEEHTTLLLNCFTKLSDEESLSKFLGSTLSSHPTRGEGGEGEGKEEPAFNLPSALSVLRQSSYHTQALYLASRYAQHTEYLQIKIEDLHDGPGALQYIRGLGVVRGAEELGRWGRELLALEAEEGGGTREAMVDVCCGVLAPVSDELEEMGGKDAPGGKGMMSYLGYGGPELAAPATNGKATPARSSTPTPQSLPVRKTTLDVIPLPTVDLPSPTLFFPHFTDHPHEFILFLEEVLARRYDRSALVASLGHVEFASGTFEQSQELRGDDEADEGAEGKVLITLFELYLSHPHSPSDPTSADPLQGKALSLLRARAQLPAFNEVQALIISTAFSFPAGFLELWEQMGMYAEIVDWWISTSRDTEGEDGSNSRKVIAALERYSTASPGLVKPVLQYLTSTPSLLSLHEADILRILHEMAGRHDGMGTIEVVRLLGESGLASVGLVREYLRGVLGAERTEMESDQALISSYRTESAKKLQEIATLSSTTVPRVFQVTRCTACGGQLELPAWHFMCRHSYHSRCLPENETNCPTCAKEQGMIKEILLSNRRFADDHQAFVEQVRDSNEEDGEGGGGFGVVARGFGKGLF